MAFSSQTTMPTKNKNVEEQLFKFMMRGGKLLDTYCPSCDTPLIKEGETPDVMSPSAILASASTTSFDGFDEAESSGKGGNNAATEEWDPIVGVPFCVSCEACVVTTEQELAYASERMALSGKRQKKGSMIVALGESNSSPQKVNSKTTAKETVSSVIAPDGKLNVEDRVPSTSPLGLAPLVMGGFKSVANVQTPFTRETAVQPVQQKISEKSPSVEATVEKNIHFDASAEGIPVSPATVDIPVDAAAEGIPINASTEEIPVVASAEDVPVPASEKETVVPEAIPEVKPLEDVPTRNVEPTKPIEAPTVIVEAPKEEVEHAAPEMEYKEKRSLATRILGSKMLQGYTLQQIPCDVCSMPLMEKGGSIACVVCPALAAKRLEDAEKKKAARVVEVKVKPTEIALENNVSMMTGDGEESKNEPPKSVSASPEYNQQVAKSGDAQSVKSGASLKDMAKVPSFSDHEAPDKKPAIISYVSESAFAETTPAQGHLMLDELDNERSHFEENQVQKQVVAEDAMSRTSHGSKTSKGSKASKVSMREQTAAVATQVDDSEGRERALLEKKKNIESSWEAERGALEMQLSQLESESNHRAAASKGDMYMGRQTIQTKKSEMLHRQAEKDAQARTRLMMSLEHESSSSICSPSHDSVMPATPRTLAKWDKLRKKSRSEMSKRMMQGWTLSDECCEGRECYGMFLLSDRGRSMYCSVCQGSGTGVDGQYTTTFHSSGDVPRLTMPSQIQPIEVSGSVETENYLMRHQQQRQDSESRWRSGGAMEKRTPSLPPQSNRMSMSPVRPPRPSSMMSSSTYGIESATMSTTIPRVDSNKNMPVPRTLQRQNSDDDGNCSVLSDASSRAKSIASDALGMIMERIEKAKTQLVLPNETGSLSQGDLASQMEVAALIEKLASAAVAVRKLEELS